MESADDTQDVVHPGVRAYVSSLVTALGGSGADEEGRYILGDDALACLRDLKQWLKSYDQKKNTLDVARCLAESNLVGGDLLQILATWPENATEDRFKSKIALACLELLVPLTWPLEKNIQQMTVNHHRHTPYLEIAQLGYKRDVINYDGARILHTAVRCALPSIAQDIGDRRTRDEGIIKLLLYFLRNIAMIAPPPNVQYEGDEAEISRSTLIDAFDYQDIFQLLLTFSSSMGEDFNTQDVVVLDVIFHLIKGIDIKKLFLDERQAKTGKMDELAQLREKEAAMLRSYQTHAPTRHNRFGPMVWIQREDGKKTAVSGQAALSDSTRGLAKMDSTKKFRPPRRALKAPGGPMDFDITVNLTVQATKHLRDFVEEFLDAGFNPLFNHVRKAIDREAERVLQDHPRQFFYLVSWFLEAERVRRQSKVASNGQKSVNPDDLDSFSLVASVLSQEMFITLNRAMDSAFENKLWPDLNAAMRCFTQILLTVQEMCDSPLEEDQEIAENILNRIFYEETTHDRVANITRTYKDQGFGYLDSVTDLAHNYLRILEQYSKQNKDLQVRSRRRVRRKKKAAKASGEDDDGGDIDESEEEDEARAERTSNERKFDFKRFASRFTTQGCVDTFVKFTGNYNDLSTSQLKRAHRFFYRVAFKQEMSVMLFRVDIISLLHKMVKGPRGLDIQSSSYKEWEEFVKQILRRCFKKIQERPELVVEMLFSKINSTAHYLEYGYERQTLNTKPRPAAELEVKPGKEWEEQVGIVVGAMLDRNEAEHLQWIKTQLSTAESERRSWEGANAALQSIEDDPFAEQNNEAPVQATEPQKAPSILVKPDSDSLKLAIFKNGYLRLLMSLIGLQHVGEDDDPECSWVVPSLLSADQLNQSLDLIKKAEFSPPTFDGGQEAGDFIRRKSAGTAARKRAVFDDDDDGIDDDDEEELLFPAGGPTAMKKSEALEALKKKRRRRRKEGSEDVGLTEEQLQARREARRQKELEKNRKIKSDLFVHDSDDETDEERDRAFFEQEQTLRQKTNAAILKELLNVGKRDGTNAKKNSMKRDSSAISADSDEDEDMVMTSSKKRRSSPTWGESDDEDNVIVSGHSSPTAKDNVLDDSDEEATDTPMSSPHTRPSQTKKRKLMDEGEEDPVSQSPTVTGGLKGTANTSSDEDEDEDDMPAVRPTRPRVRAGFIVDSSDDE